MPNKRRENLLFGDWVELVNSDSCNLLSQAFLLKSFGPFLRQPRFVTAVRLWVNFEGSYNFTASTLNGFIHIFSHHCRCYSDFVQMFHLVFHDGNQRSYHNNRKWHSILPSFQRTLYSRKKLENKSFSKASRWNCEDIYPADYVFPLLFAFSLHVWRVTQRCVCCEFEFWTERRVCHHLHIPFFWCDRRRSTVDKNCQNQPIRGYTRIWYTGTHFC